LANGFVCDDLLQIAGNFGNILMQRGALEPATDALRTAAELAPHDADIWMNLGVALQMQGSFDAALDAYRRAESLAPPSALLLENMGSVYLKLGDRGATHQAFVRTLQLDPQRPKARGALRALDQTGDAPTPP